jgi:O-antigen ligase
VLENIVFSIKELKASRPVWLVFILFIGFVFAPGAADVAQLKVAAAGSLPAGKIIRVISVAIVGILALIIVARSGRLPYVFKGNLALMVMFAFFALATVVSSEIKSLTLYKSTELFVIILVAASVYTDKYPAEAARKFIIGLMWLYALILIGVYGQLFVLGKEAFRQISSTSFQTFMLRSYYPPIESNSLGFMAAILILFGAFLFFANLTRMPSKGKTVGLIIIVFSMAIMIMSYTRSILAILALVGLLYLLYNRKYGWFILCVSILITSLALPQVRTAIEMHMLRGDSEQNLETLSSRTMLWKMALDKDLLPLIMGEGYATGTMFIGYDSGSIFGAKTQQIRNAHNSVLEIINSAGIIGAMIWIVLMVRIFVQLLRQLKRYKPMMTVNERYFHLLILMLSLMSILRSMMNSTYVYLDLFMPLLLAMAVYADTLPSLMRSRIQSNRAATDEVKESNNQLISDSRILYKKAMNSSG